MGLKAVIDGESFSKLDPSLQEHYQESDGSYMLSVEAANGLELTNPTKLKTALQTERNNVSNLKKSLQSFDGLDAEKAREALEKFEALGGLEEIDSLDEKLKAREKQLEDKYRSQYERESSKYKSDIEKIQQEKEKLRSQLHREMITSAATNALSKAGGNVDLLLPAIERRVKTVTDEDGREAVRIIGADGQPRLSPRPSSSDYMTIEELVAEMQDSDTYSVGFSSTNANGTGKGGSGDSKGGRGSVVRITREQAKNSRTYREARERAAKNGQEFEITD